MERNQILFSGLDFVKKEGIFLESLLKTEIPESEYWFNRTKDITSLETYLTHPEMRELDPDMNLETYLAHVNGNTLIDIRLSNPEKILCLVSGVHLEENPDIERVLFYECPSNEVNNERIKGLLRNAFGDYSF